MPESNLPPGVTEWDIDNQFGGRIPTDFDEVVDDDSTFDLPVDKEDPEEEINEKPLHEDEQPEQP